MLEGGEWEAQGLKRTKQGAKPSLGSAASGAGAGAVVGLTLPSSGMGTGGREGPFPRTVRVEGRSWRRGWCIMLDARGFRGASPVPRPRGSFTSNVSLAVACRGHLPLREK